MKYARTTVVEHACLCADEILHDGAGLLLWDLMPDEAQNDSGLGKFTVTIVFEPDERDGKERNET